MPGTGRYVAGRREIDMSVRSIIALGANVGDRAGTISRALRALQKFGTVESTASLVESAAAYVTEQPPFLNTVCALHTSLAPLELLGALKAIERDLGRIERQRWGPREIDLDLLLYGDAVLRTGTGARELELPHPRIAERDFVLQPLAEIAPSLVHPVHKRTIGQLDRALGSERLQRVTPLRDGSALRWGERTYIMGVLNTTPDSFSDGGDFEGAEAAVQQGLAMQAAGADVLDIGAQSTRPGAPFVTPEEEVRRAAPVVRGLLERGLRIPISIDTFSSAVAEELVGMGASIVNDVTAGAHDPQMLSTISRLGVPAVLMHMRGTPQTMQQLTQYSDVVVETRAELHARLMAAEAVGVPRWNLISDVGIGFAKTAEHNLTLLGQLHRFGREPPSVDGREGELGESGGLGLPLLVGVSRKSFIGSLLGGLPPKERGWGTAAACAACIPHADLLRVHDVAEMKQVAVVADAICRAAGASSVA